MPFSRVCRHPFTNLLIDQILRAAVVQVSAAEQRARLDLALHQIAERTLFDEVEIQLGFRPHQEEKRTALN